MVSCITLWSFPVDDPEKQDLKFAHAYAPEILFFYLASEYNFFSSFGGKKRYQIFKNLQMTNFNLSIFIRSNLLMVYYKKISYNPLINIIIIHICKVKNRKKKILINNWFPIKKIRFKKILIVDLWLTFLTNNKNLDKIDNNNDLILYYIYILPITVYCI